MAQATPFQKEAWSEYALGVCIILVRIFARIKVVGFKNWQGDDYFAILALIFWTAELVMLELIGQNGTNIGIPDDARAALTDAELAKLEFGSKCLLAGWCCYTTLIWCLKSCMLFFYNRLTLGLFQQKLVKANAILCACTYIGVMVTILAHCRPIHKNWQVNPNPGDTCTLDVENYITIVVTNMLTDAVLLAIPLPLLMKVKIPLRRKLIISVLLCSGVFVMVATLLRCVLSLKDVAGINNSTIWAIRETFVGIICVNAPCIKPLFSASTWVGYSNDKSQGKPNKYGYNMTGSGSYPMPSLKSKSKSDPDEEDACSEQIILKDGAKYGSQNAQYGYSNGVSCAKGDRNNSLGGRDRNDVPEGAGIQVTTTYEINPSSDERLDRGAPGIGATRIV